MFTVNEAAQFKGSLDVTGQFTGANRASLATETGRAYPLPIESFRVWDSYGALISTAAADDLGVTAGAFGTGCPYIVSRDLNAAGAFTGYARVQFTIPSEYVEGTTVQLRFAAGMKTSAASVTATVDAEAYVSNRTTLKTGSDLITTSATSINSTSFAEKTFDLSSGGLTVGSVLDIRVALATDSATASSHFAAIAHAEVLLSVRG